MPLPFVFQSVISNKLKIPIASYSEILTIDYPILISIGPKCLGKSRLLNRIFEPVLKFSEEQDS